MRGEKKKRVTEKKTDYLQRGILKKELYKGTEVWEPVEENGRGMHRNETKERKQSEKVNKRRKLKKRTKKKIGKENM